MHLDFGTTSLLTVAVFLAYIGVRNIRKKAEYPPTVPALVPWLGNFLSFNFNPLTFIEDCRQRYGDVYKFQMCGRNIIVFSHPDGIQSLYRDPTKSFTTAKLFTRIIDGLSGTTDNGHLLGVFELQLHRILVSHLSPSTFMPLGRDIVRMLLPQLKAVASNGSPVTLKLYDFIGRPLYNSGCHALFGPTYPSDTFDDFRLIDHKIAPLMALPFSVQDGVRARQRVYSCLIAYFEPWWDSNGRHELEGISDVMLHALQAMKASQISKENATALNLLFSFGFHTNSWYMLFWLIVQLIYDDDLMKKVQSEIVSKFPHSDKLEDNPREGVYPILDSVIEETLRWASRPTTVRLAEKDSELILHGMAIPIHKGDYVVADVRGSHLNPENYPDPEVFKFDRYMTSSSGQKSSPSKPMAWGGGKHMCLGRHLAKYQMRQFMIICLQLYDIKAVKDGKKPSLAPQDVFGSPKASEDVYITITPRGDSQQKI